MTRRSWAVLLAGLAVVALAAWLVRRDAPDPPPAAAPGTWAVRWVADGDTLDVVRDGVSARLRLVNIDAPERAHDAAPAQCLAEESRTALAELAPVGTDVHVEALEVDRFGRTIASVVTVDGRNLSVEQARAGLAAPLVVRGQVRLIAAVEDARDTAARAGKGLHDAGIPCTIEARTEAAGRLPAGAARTRDVAALRAALDAQQPTAAVAALSTAELREVRARLALLAGSAPG